MSEQNPRPSPQRPQQDPPPAFQPDHDLIGYFDRGQKPSGIKIEKGGADKDKE